MELTPEEEAEFTLWNLLAFNYGREHAALHNTIPPCWLVMSAESRQERRDAIYQQFATMFRRQYGYEPGHASFELLLEDMRLTLADNLVAWKQAEREFKRLREEEHNPRAFFVQ